VIVSAKSDANLNGVAVDILFLTTHKNNYGFIVFLDENGRAELSKSDYLPFFDSQQDMALMDYGDARTVFGGNVVARVLNEEDILRALEAYEYYSDVVPYPARRREKLQNALDPLQKQNCVPVNLPVRVRLSFIGSLNHPAGNSASES
jgi:hypothetical protein